MSESLAKHMEFTNSLPIIVIVLSYMLLSLLEALLTSTARTDFVTEPLAKHLEPYTSLSVSLWSVFSDDSDEVIITVLLSNSF